MAEPADQFAVLRADTERLMKRCQRGVGGRNALDEAHSIMAECYGTLGAILAERDALAAQVQAQWQPIETAPRDGTLILGFWPLHPFADDGNMDESKVIGGTRAVTFMSGNYWLEPDYLDATGERFDDDFCYAPNPTHWCSLPAAPSTPEGAR